MVNFRTLQLILIGTLIGLVGVWQANAFNKPEYSNKTKVSVERARIIVHKQVPGGHIISEQLEREKGGSGLRYNFYVKEKNGRTRKVGVDAITGKVLENSLLGKASKAAGHQKKQ